MTEMLEWNQTDLEYERCDKLDGPSASSKCERFIIHFYGGVWWLYWKEDRSMLNEQMPLVCFPGTGRLLTLTRESYFLGKEKNFTYIQNDSKEEAMEFAMDLLKGRCRIGAPPIIEPQ